MKPEAPGCWVVDDSEARNALATLQHQQWLREFKRRHPYRRLNPRNWHWVRDLLYKSYKVAYRLNFGPQLMPTEQITQRAIQGAIAHPYPQVTPFSFSTAHRPRDSK